MENIETSNLVTKISIDDSGVEKSMAELTRQMKLVQSEFQAASSRLGEHANSQDELKLKAETLSKQLEIQGQRVAKLKKQHEEAVAAKGKDAKETQNLEVKLNRAAAQYNKLDGELKTTTDALNKQTSAWEKASKAIDAASKKMDEAGKKMGEAGQGLALLVTAPVVAAGAASTKASIDFESAFAGVRKTVDATEEEFQQFSDEIRKMSKELPATATEIAKVAEAAGQLGIKNEAIMGFTRTMTDMRVATNMGSDEAATALARLANITQMPQSQFDRLGSTIVDLGNHLATTESEIVEMGLRLAGAGHQIGLTEAQILSFAGALSSVGIEAEAGGSAFSRVMINMAQAAATGGKDLDNFAAVAGMTSTQFKETFERDAAGALVAFIEGLGNLSAAGENTFAALDQLGLSEIRVRDALLRASGAGDLFRTSLETGTKAWEENVALSNEANERYGTTASKMQMLGNRIVDAAITLGDALVPALMAVLDALEPLFKSIEEGAAWFASLDASSQKTIITIVAFAAAAGPLLIITGKLATSISALIPAVKGLGVAFEFLTTKPLGIALTSLTVGLTAVAFTVYQVTKALEEKKRATEELAAAQEELNRIEREGISLDEIDATEEKIQKLDDLISKYQELIEVAGKDNPSWQGASMRALITAGDELGYTYKDLEAKARDFHVELEFIDDAGKLSAKSLEQLRDRMKTYTRAVQDAKAATSATINEKARQIAVQKQEIDSAERALKVYKSAKKGTDDWTAAQQDLARMFPQLTTATGVNTEAVEGLLIVKRREVELEWQSIQAKAASALQETQTAIKKQEAAIAIAESIKKIAGSSGLAETAIKKMNDELDRLRGEAASLKALVDLDPKDVKLPPVVVPTMPTPKDPKTKEKASKAYENKALDEAYRLLEHKKRLDQLTLEEELKTLEAIKAKHIKTAEERMTIEEKIYDVKKALGDASLEKSLKDYERAKELGKLSENDEINRLRRIKKLYADSAEERERLDDMIFEATRRKIESEKQLRKETTDYVSQQLRAAYEDRLAREELSAEESYKLQDRLLNDQIYLNKNYLEKVLVDARYTEAEKKKIEREVTEEIRRQTNERLLLERNYAEEVRKANIDAVNNMSKGIQDALKAKYQAEKAAAEESIKAAQQANEEWKRAQLESIKTVYDARVEAAQKAADAEIERINSVYNARIESIQKELDALDQAEKKRSRAELDAEDQKKIDRLKKKLEFEHDDYNKKQLQGQLNKAIAELNERHRQEELEDKKEALKEEQKELKDKLAEETKAIKDQLTEKKEIMAQEYEAQQANINAIYAAQKASLDQQMADTQEHYNKLLEAKAIQAEAEKMIVQNQQEEILQLLEGFGDSYNITGQTLGEKMYQGFREKVMQIQDLIDSINRQIDAARSAAVSAMNTATAAASSSSKSSGSGSSGYTTSGSIVVNNTFTSPVTSPSDVSRATTKSAQRLAMGV